MTRAGPGGDPMARTSTNSKAMTIAPASVAARGPKGAAANEKHCSEHGATADEKKERQPGDREVGEDGTPELVDGRRVEPDE